MARYAFSFLPLAARKRLHSRVSLPRCGQGHHRGIDNLKPPLGSPPSGLPNIHFCVNYQSSSTGATIAAPPTGPQIVTAPLCPRRQQNPPLSNPCAFAEDALNHMPLSHIANSLQIQLPFDRRKPSVPRTLAQRRVSTPSTTSQNPQSGLLQQQAHLRKEQIAHLMDLADFSVGARLLTLDK